MADIELVIKIPEEKLSLIKNKRYCGLYDSDLYKAIANGMQLPKGHGRLIDADDLKWQFDKRDELNSFTENIIAGTPTIIEADRERNE